MASAPPSAPAVPRQDRLDEQQQHRPGAPLRLPSSFEGAMIDSYASMGDTGSEGQDNELDITPRELRAELENLMSLRRRSLQSTSPLDPDLPSSPPAHSSAPPPSPPAPAATAAQAQGLAIPSSPTAPTAAETGTLARRRSSATGKRPSEWPHPEPASSGAAGLAGAAGAQQGFTRADPTHDQPPPTPQKTQQQQGQQQELFWLPASLHPELAPQEFKAFIREQTTPSALARRLSSGARSSATGGRVERRKSTLRGEYKPSTGDGVGESPEASAGGDGKVKRSSSEGAPLKRSNNGPLWELPEVGEGGFGAPFAELTIKDLQRLEQLAARAEVEQAQEGEGEGERLGRVLRRSLSLNPSTVAAAAATAGSVRLSVSPESSSRLPSQPLSSSVASTSSNTSSIAEEPPSDGSTADEPDKDSPLIYVPPGQILRRNARTKIRKSGPGGVGVAAGEHRFGPSTGAGRRGRQASTGVEETAALERQTSDQEPGAARRTSEEDWAAETVEIGQATRRVIPPPLSLSERQPSAERERERREASSVSPPLPLPAHAPVGDSPPLPSLPPPIPSPTTRTPPGPTREAREERRRLSISLPADLSAMTAPSPPPSVVVVAPPAVPATAPPAPAAAVSSPAPPPVVVAQGPAPSSHDFDWATHQEMQRLARLGQTPAPPPVLPQPVQQRQQAQPPPPMQKPALERSTSFTAAPLSPAASTSGRPASVKEGKEKEKKSGWARLGLGSKSSNSELNKKGKDKDKEPAVTAAASSGSMLEAAPAAAPPVLRKASSQEKEKEKEGGGGFFGGLFGGRKKGAEDRESAAANHSPPPLSPPEPRPPPPPTASGALMPDGRYINFYRLPIHVERAVYRLSHIKLANPRRPLYEQVLISNLMFWYLGLVNKANAPPPKPQPVGVPSFGEDDEGPAHHQMQGQEGTRPSTESERNWIRGESDTPPPEYLEHAAASANSQQGGSPTPVVAVQPPSTPPSPTQPTSPSSPSSGKRPGLSKPARQPGGRSAETPVRQPQYEAQNRQLAMEQQQQQQGAGDSRPHSRQHSSPGSSGPHHHQQQQHVPPQAAQHQRAASAGNEQRGEHDYNYTPNNSSRPRQRSPRRSPERSSAPAALASVSPPPLVPTASGMTLQQPTPIAVPYRESHSGFQVTSRHRKTPSGGGSSDGHGSYDGAGGSYNEAMLRRSPDGGRESGEFGERVSYDGSRQPAHHTLPLPYSSGGGGPRSPPLGVERKRKESLSSNGGGGGLKTSGVPLSPDRGGREWDQRGAPIASPPLRGASKTPPASWGQQPQEPAPGYFAR